MATRIFLGEPPAKIKQWIIDHYGIPNMERLPILLQEIISQAFFQAY